MEEKTFAKRALKRRFCVDVEVEMYRSHWRVKTKFAMMGLADFRLCIIEMIVIEFSSAW